MKLTHHDLRTFLAILPAYDSLPDGARYELMSWNRRLGTDAAHRLHGHAKALTDAGFLLPAAEKGRYTVAPEGEVFIRVLHLLDGSDLFYMCDADGLSRILEKHLSAAERQALLDGVRSGGPNRSLFREVTSPSWIEGLLKAHSGDWEKPFLKPDLPAALSDPEVFRTVQEVIRLLLNRAGPVAMRELPQLWSNSDLLVAALLACFRYALVFAGLKPSVHDPVITLWPRVERPLEESTSSLQAVTPSQTYDSAFLMEDMTALLMVCAAKPIRLNAASGALIAKVGRDLAQSLGRQPKWVEDGFEYTSEMRAHTTVSYLQTFQLVERKGGAPILQISNRGKQWLELGASDRLRVLVDGVLDRRQVIAGFEDFAGAQVGAAAPHVDFRTSMMSPPDVIAAMFNPVRSLAGVGFYSVAELVARCRANDNPLIEVLSHDPTAEFGIGGYRLDRPDGRKLRTEWAKVVKELIRIRLLPQGAVRLGSGKEGLSIAVTPVGRYYLGQTQDWPRSSPKSQVIVQPNFEVTFLGEARGAEAEIVQFAERRGERTGVVFQITRKSIFRAAQAGMKPEAVIAILERVGARELPVNVRQEIAGWFGQCRTVSLESAMLIRCPDAETAALVMGAVRDNVVPLSDTVLEYKGTDKQRAGLMKKLSENGVLVSGKE